MQNPSPVIKNYIVSPDAFVLEENQVANSISNATAFTKKLTQNESGLFIIFIFGILLYSEFLTHKKLND